MTDLPTHRDLIGMVLALGLVFRTGGHVFAALALDRDPHLDDATDVRLASPVPSLRDDGAHMVARLGVAAFGMFVAWGYGSAFPGAGSLGGLWVLANWLVLVGDPVAGVALLAVGRLRRGSITEVKTT